MQKRGNPHDDESDSAVSEAKDIEKGRWHLEGISPEAVLELLVHMDRVMLAIRQDGLLHERLGPVASVTVKDGDILIAGDQQDTRLPQGLLTACILDTTTTMRDKPYPRLEFSGADGERLFSVTGLEGSAPMLNALEGIARRPAPPRGETPAEARPEDIDPADPGLRCSSDCARMARSSGSRPGATGCASIGAERSRS